MKSKCWYCGMVLEGHSLRELKYCWNQIHNKLYWYEGMKTK